MNKTISIILILVFAAAFVFIFIGGAKNENGGQSLQNVEIKEGVQYVSISAKGGYSPQVTEAKAGMPTKLIVKTKGTYDCSAYLVVRQANFQNILPQTGETEIDIGTKNAGETVTGVCSMGMYSFTVKFI